MRSHAMDKWAKRAMSHGGYVGEVEKSSPMPSFDDDDEDTQYCDLGFAHGGECYSQGGIVEKKSIEPDFSLASDPDIEDSFGAWDEEKDLEVEKDLGGAPMGRQPRGFAKGGFVMALRSRRG